MKTFIIIYLCLIATWAFGQSAKQYSSVADTLKCGYDPDTALAAQIRELILKGKGRNRVHKTER